MDLETLRSWRNTPRLNKVFRTPLPISSESQEQWFQLISQPNPPHLMYAADWRGRLIGCAGLCYLDWVHRNAEISLYLAEDNGRNDIIKLLIDLAFNKFNLHKLYAEMIDLPDWRIPMYQTFGFKECGRYHNHRWVDGDWVDSILLEKFNDSSDSS